MEWIPEEKRSNLLQNAIINRLEEYFEKAYNSMVGDEAKTSSTYLMLSMELFKRMNLERRLCSSSNIKIEQIKDIFEEYQDLCMKFNHRFGYNRCKVLYLPE